MDKLSDGWRKLTTPQAVNADEARREYTTKVILVILSAIALAITPFVVLGWIIGIFDILVLIVPLVALPIFVVACGWLS